MKIDVVRYGPNTVLSLASVPGITKFKKEFSNWFNESSKIYIRYVGKNLIDTWRHIPNKSTEFYRCPKVTSQDLISKLNFDFIAYSYKVFDKE